MPKGKPNAKHVKFTEELNGVDYLEKAYEGIQRLPRDPKAWNWVVIGLHGALYSFAICALKGSDWTRVTKPGTRRLIPFDEAIKRCQTTDWMTQSMRSRPVQLTDDQKGAIRFLKGSGISSSTTRRSPGASRSTVWSRVRSTPSWSCERSSSTPGMCASIGRSGTPPTSAFARGNSFSRRPSSTRTTSPRVKRKQRKDQQSG